MYEILLNSMIVCFFCFVSFSAIILYFQDKFNAFITLGIVILNIIGFIYFSIYMKRSMYDHNEVYNIILLIMYGSGIILSLYGMKATYKKNNNAFSSLVIVTVSTVVLGLNSILFFSPRSLTDLFRDDDKIVFNMISHVVNFSVGAMVIWFYISYFYGVLITYLFEPNRELRYENSRKLLTKMLNIKTYFASAVTGVIILLFILADFDITGFSPSFQSKYIAINNVLLMLVSTILIPLFMSLFGKKASDTKIIKTKYKGRNSRMRRD